MGEVPKIGVGSRLVLGLFLVFLERVLLDPPLSLRVGPRDVRLEVVPADAPGAASAGLGRAELAAAYQGVCLAMHNRAARRRMLKTVAPTGARVARSGRQPRASQNP